MKLYHTVGLDEGVKILSERAIVLGYKYLAYLGVIPDPLAVTTLERDKCPLKFQRFLFADTSKSIIYLQNSMYCNKNCNVNTMYKQPSLLKTEV